MITLASLSELHDKIRIYEAAVLRLEKTMKISAIVVYYEGHDCDRTMTAEDLDAVRDLLLQRQHHHVLNLQRALAREGIDVDGEVERVSKLCEGQNAHRNS